MARWRSFVGSMLACLLVAGSFAASIAGFVPAASAGQSLPDTLTAGHAIDEGNEGGLVSRNGEFYLGVDAITATLYDDISFSGPRGHDSAAFEVWHTGIAPDRKRGVSRLRMQHDGDLTFYSRAGHAVWTTHTYGSGSHNRLVLQNNGNLVMYTATNRKVWSSNTTAVVLAAGHTLPSGHVLMVRQGTNVPIRRLVMHTDGDLAYYCGSRLAWHTGTRRAGAYLAMRRDGDLVVYGPSNRLLWSSRTAGIGPYSYLNVTDLAVYRQHFVKKWQARIPVAANCD